jgi:hypothetical protein
MKRIFSNLLALILFAGLYACDTQSQKIASAASAGGDENVTVYYFHLTSRCVTCKTVEAVSKEAVASLFPEQVKAGVVQFVEVNLELPENQQLMETLQVAGQSLLVVKGDRQVDITDKGFLYARSQPERLREEIRKAVEEI